jgi:hypothetical protein
MSMGIKKQNVKTGTEPEKIDKPANHYNIFNYIQQLKKYGQNPKKRGLKLRPVCSRFLRCVVCGCGLFSKATGFLL